MNNLNSIRTLAAAAATAVLFSTASAWAGTYVTDPLQVAGTTPVATSTSVAGSDATSLQLANDSTNLYVYLTFNTSVDGGTYLAIDSDNDASTGYHIFTDVSIGSNLGIQYGTGFTQAAGKFNTDPAYYGSGTGSVLPATFSSTATSTTLLYTIPLTTAQIDADSGGYTGLAFPTSTFTLEAYQDSGNTLGHVTYTLAAVPEPASLGLLSLAALPLMRRRRTRE